MKLTNVLAKSALFLVLACGEKDSDADGLHDTDGDGISDEDEGGKDVNTDGDDYPDYRDLDSDGDGISDEKEAGDDDLETPPVDTDSDGTPDYLDTDSDGDGILDRIEASGGEVKDTDEDGIPDFLDEDADGDGTPDAEQGTGDADGDGVPDYLDDDVDGDCIKNEDEFDGDSDDDGAPDFRDEDSDGDFVLDGDEDKNCNGKVDDGESDPRSTDSDEDGTPDLIEVIAGSDPADPDDTIPEGDFYFVLPYQGPGDEGKLSFSTSVRKADVFISMDTTGSFGEEIDAVNSALSDTIVPGIEEIIDDVAFGVGRFEDMPLDPYGLSDDLPYELLQSVTTDLDKVQEGLSELKPTGGGLDIAESGYEALYQWASGAGLPEFGFAPFAPKGIGGVGFRGDSLPIIVHITDAISHEGSDYADEVPGAHGSAAAFLALQSIGARVIGVDSLENANTDDDPRAQLEELATETKALIPPDKDSGKCLMGVDNAPIAPKKVDGRELCPVVFDVAPDGSGLGDLIVDAVAQLATLGTLDISTRARGGTEGLGDAKVVANHTTADFIQSITPVDPPPKGATIDKKVVRNVTPGSTVEFDLEAFNDFQPSKKVDQLFEAQIDVLGDEVTVLDVRNVYIIVPRYVPEPVIIR